MTDMFRVRLGSLAIVIALSTTVPWSSVFAGDGGPLRLSERVDVTLGPLPFSASCGFEVYVHVTGKTDVLLFLDPSGNVVREVDTIPGLKATFFAPSTGKSVDRNLQSVVSEDYLADGTARTTATGDLSIIHLAGGAPLQIRAGRQVSIDEIIGHLPVVIDGRSVSIPIVGNTIKIISADGVAQGDLVEAICSALH